MPIDPSIFHPHNIADTCAVWNILSSRTLFSRARDAGVTFVCTHYVVYECLFKPRKKPTSCDQELQRRFRAAQQNLHLDTWRLDVADLQTIEILENRKRLGKGELSSIAFSLKTRQAFLTDDQKARKLAGEILRKPNPQTTPHLFGWLFFTTRLVDSEKKIVIREHN